MHWNNVWFLPELPHMHMWQSQVEIEHYPLCISTTLPCSKRCSTVLLLRAGLIALCRLIRYWCSFAARMSPTLNGFECSNVLELCRGIMFDFYPGLAHMYSTIPSLSSSTLVCLCVQWCFTGVFLRLPSQRGVWAASARKETPQGTNELASVKFEYVCHCLHLFYFYTHRTHQLSAESKVHVCEHTLHYNSWYSPKVTYRFVPSFFKWVRKQRYLLKFKGKIVCGICCIATGSTYISVAQTPKSRHET